MANAPKKRSAAESTRLSRDDWLDAAFSAVVEGGFDNVRVLGLASALGVTRGSFYWHFVDHAALITALLERWRTQEMGTNQAFLSAACSDPHADLEQLLDAALAHAGSELENMRFELALRGLGRRDPSVATLLQEVDQARMRLFESKFLRLTDDAQLASELATLFYLAIVGSHQALSRPSTPPGAKNHLKDILARHLIHRLAAPSSSADDM